MRCWIGLKTCLNTERTASVISGVLINKFKTKLNSSKEENKRCDNKHRSTQTQLILYKSKVGLTLHYELAQNTTTTKQPDRLRNQHKRTKCS